MSKKVKFDFDERSLKTLEELKESEETFDMLRTRVRSFDTPHDIHVARQLFNRDREITQLLSENIRLRTALQEIADVSPDCKWVKQEQGVREYARRVLGESQP